MANFDAAAFVAALPAYSPSTSAAIGYGRTALIIGPKGSGKSTLAEALIAASGATTVYRPSGASSPSDSSTATPSLAAVMSVMREQEGVQAAYLHESVSATTTEDTLDALGRAYGGGARAANLFLVNTVQSPLNVPKAAAGAQDLVMILPPDNAYDMQNAWTRHFRFGQLSTLANFKAVLDALPPYTALVLDARTPGISNLEQGLCTYTTSA